MFKHLHSASNDWQRLDLLRFIAAAGIVVFHSHQYFFDASARGLVSRDVAGLSYFVDMFFVISGFIISVIYWDKIQNLSDFGRFMKRRVARLIPLHWLVLSLSLILWLMIIGLSKQLTAAGFNLGGVPEMSVACVVHGALLLNGVSGCGAGAELTPVSWSIGIEMMLYLLFPVFLLFAKRLPVLLALFAIILTAYVGQSLHFFDMPGRSQLLFRGMAPFLFGMILYHQRDLIGQIKPATIWLPLSLATTILVMITGNNHLMVLALVYFTTFIAVASDLAGAAGSLIARWAPLGQLTYGIYMWHSLFILVLLDAFADKLLKLETLPMILVAALCYAAIIIWSYWSWRYFESPARHIIDGRAAKPVAAQPA